MSIMAYCIILTTSDKKEIADKIALKLVESDLAKCVQIDSVESFYKWEDKLLTQKEFRLMIKTRSENYKLIERIILDLHNYELPQIIKIDITDGLGKYLNWLKS